MPCKVKSMNCLPQTSQKDFLASWYQQNAFEQLLLILVDRDFAAKRTFHFTLDLFAFPVQWCEMMWKRSFHFTLDLFAFPVQWCEIYSTVEPVGHYTVRSPATNGHIFKQHFFSTLVFTGRSIVSPLSFTAHFEAI